MKSHTLRIKIDENENEISISSNTLASLGDSELNFLPRYRINLGYHNYHFKLSETNRPERVIWVGSKIANELCLEEGQTVKLSLSEAQELSEATFECKYDDAIDLPELIPGIEISSRDEYIHDGGTLKALSASPEKGYLTSSTIIYVDGKEKGLSESESIGSPDPTFKQSQDETMPASGFGEFHIKKPKRSFEELYGYDELTNPLKDILDLVTGKKEIKYAYSKSPNILLYGPPGTGKTHVAEACAYHADCLFFSFSASQFENKWLGESAHNVRKLFKIAREHAPTIIHIDEIDAIVAHRENVYAAQVINQLRTEMDGVTPNSGVIVIATTNYIEEIDAPILSRFNHQLQVELPDEVALAKIIDAIFSPIKEANFNHMDMAKMLIGHSPRKIIEIRDKICHMLNTGEKTTIRMSDIMALVEYQTPESLTTILNHRLS